MSSILDALFRPAGGPPARPPQLEVSATELALFSPASRRANASMCSASSKGAEPDAHAERALFGTTAILAAASPLARFLASPSAAARPPASARAPEPTAGARGAGPLVAGAVLKRTRWGAWRPRWATLTRDGLLEVARREGEPPVLRLRAAELCVELAKKGEDRGARSGAAGGAGGVAPSGVAEIVLSAPDGRKLKICAQAAQLEEWARALGARRAPGGGSAPAA